MSMCMQNDTHIGAGRRQARSSASYEWPGGDFLPPTTHSRLPSPQSERPLLSGS